jgi:TolB protein
VRGIGRGRVVTLVLAILVLLSACTAGSQGQRPATRPATSTAGSEPTAPAARQHAPSLAGRIAFDNHQDVWTINADGTDLTRLTHSPGPDFDPSWSPDGTQIAFRSERHGVPEIWLMNADGSGEHRLAAGLSPAWSPDGSTIALSGAHGLSLIDANGSHPQTLPHTEGGEYPSWSPDGTRIAFNSNLSGDHVMYIVRADGSQVVDLTRTGEGWQVAWSPDGRSILFTSHRDRADGYTDVYVMRPDGSGVRRLTHNLAYTPAWSPDGRHIVFSAPGLFIMNADGTGITALATPGIAETSLPDWTR